MRGVAKREAKKACASSTSCPEALIIREAECQTDAVTIPLLRVRNLAGVYGAFGIGLANITV
ncbi:MAG: hypothetical protein QXT13_06330 [Pyrobaculum sp.]